MADAAHSISTPKIRRLLPTCLPGLSSESWRSAIEERIELHLKTVDALVRALDLRDGDTDFESDTDGEPWLGWPDGMPGRGAVVCGVTGDDDREDADENGGDILDELHDASDEGDDEPDLGRLETMEQGASSYGGECPTTDRNSIGKTLDWRQDGYAVGNRMLRNRGLPMLKGAPVRGWW